MGAIYLRLRRIYLRIKHDPKRFEYTDLAITPVTDDEIETHEMFHNAAARAYVARSSGSRRSATAPLPASPG